VSNIDKQDAVAQQNRGAQQSPRFVLGLYLQALLDAYCEQGGDLDELATVCGLAEGFLYALPEKVSVSLYLDLIQGAKDITSDPIFGLNIGRFVHASSFDILGLAMVKAENLGQATEQALALENLVHSLGRSELIRESGCIRFVWHCHFQRHPLARVLSESVLAGIVTFAKMLAGRSIPVLEVTFAHSIDKDVALNTYFDFLGGSCTFDQQHNSLLVADEVLAWPVVNTLSSAGRLGGSGGGQSKKPLLPLLKQYLEQKLSQGNPSLSLAAEYFCITPRTLQRRLNKESANYQDTLNEIRCQLAEDYLRYSNLNLFELSQVLGFAEQSSFNHFFLAQFKCSPSQYLSAGDS